jgi:hypothetical protein
MGNGDEDFWPDLTASAVRTPASILKTQAAALSKKTHGLLGGEVDTWTYKDSIYHRFYVVVPALENYRYSLMRVHHGPTLYPVIVDEDPVDGDRGMLAHDFKDEEAFRAWLRESFNRVETRRILESLLAQAVA